MRKRTLTPEQIAAKAERQARTRLFAKQVGALSPAQRLEMASKAGLQVVGERSLSPFNQCLVIFQRPTATVVGGFKQWLAAGRCVRKGEHGLSIWVPIGPKNENGDVEKIGFVGGTVFDIAQTNELEVVAQ